MMCVYILYSLTLVCATRVLYNDIILRVRVRVHTYIYIYLSVSADLLVKLMYICLCACLSLHIYFFSIAYTCTYTCAPTCMSICLPSHPPSPILAPHACALRKYAKIARIDASRSLAYLHVPTRARARKIHMWPITQPSFYIPYPHTYTRNYICTYKTLTFVCAVSRNGSHARHDDLIRMNFSLTLSHCIHIHTHTHTHAPFIPCNHNDDDDNANNGLGRNDGPDRVLRDSDRRPRREGARRARPSRGVQEQSPQGKIQRAVHRNTYIHRHMHIWREMSRFSAGTMCDYGPTSAFARGNDDNDC